MQLTPNYNLKKPEGIDPVDIQDFNDNADILDAELNKKADSSGGDISNMTIKALDEPAGTQFPVPEAGETSKTFLGKIRKFMNDFKSWNTGVCMIGQIVNNCVTNNDKLPLSAAQGKVLMDLYSVLNTNFTRLENDLEAQLVKGSLLTYALNLEAGFKNIQVGDGTTDKPINYAGGYIIKRKIYQPTIVLYDLSTGTTYSNTYDGSWRGWRSSLSDSDISYRIKGVEANNIIWSYEVDDNGPFIRLTADGKRIAFWRVSGTYE